ncbi:MAG: hypothetical protein OR994_07550 [Candidatus Poseidoniales archaeon]|nr:hypothetical protein [Candidatus Poseidoniales archaeon]
MSGGGTAPAMKMSDVFILVSISILVGSLIMHSWPATVSLSNDVSHSKNLSLSEGDEVNMQFSASNATTVTISMEGEIVKEIVMGEDSKEKFAFKVESSKDYNLVISVNGEDNTSITEVVISIDRQSMLDKIVYPVGVLLLVFGLYKRKEEKELESSKEDILDAEIDV